MSPFFVLAAMPEASTRPSMRQCATSRTAGAGGAGAWPVQTLAVIMANIVARIMLNKLPQRGRLMKPIVTRLSILVLLAVCVSAARADDAKELFNGKDLSGWDGDQKFWTVEDGAITGR